MAQLGNPVASSQKALMLEMKSLQDEPVEGFKITLVNESDMYNWEVAIFGPPNTHYEGGYFKALLKFPVDYPYSPPNFRFLTKMWHPNIYENGEVCISILHPPVDDPHSGELPSERWNPTQNVRTILLSVISLLNEPNTFSPANVDASVMYRRWRESKGEDQEYIEIISRCRPPKAKPTLTASRFPSRWRNTASAPKCQPRTTAPTCCTTTAPASCTTTTPPSCTKTTTKTRRTTTATRRAFATTTGTFVLSTRTRNMRLRIPTEIDHHPVSRTHQFCFFFPCFYRRCVNGTPLVLLISNVPRCGVWNVFLCFLLVNWFI
ncbi:cell division cycle 34 homolog a isoform X2 [Stigmatopora argus]